jgi:hypothetical protein
MPGTIPSQKGSYSGKTVYDPFCCPVLEWSKITILRYYMLIVLPLLYQIITTLLPLHHQYISQILLESAQIFHPINYYYQGENKTAGQLKQV